MLEFFQWFTDMGNSKTAAAVIFFAVFIGILVYVFTNKDRKARYDDYCKIPLMDDEDLGSVNQSRSDQADLSNSH